MTRRISDEGIGLFKEDIDIVNLERAERCVDNWVTVEIRQEEFDHLVRLVYNEGCKAFKRSALLKRINRGQLEEVMAEDLMS